MEEVLAELVCAFSLCLCVCVKVQLIGLGFIRKWVGMWPSASQMGS